MKLLIFCLVFSLSICAQVESYHVSDALKKQIITSILEIDEPSDDAEKSIRMTLAKAARSSNDSSTYIDSFKCRTLDSAVYMVEKIMCTIVLHERFDGETSIMAVETIFRQGQNDTEIEIIDNDFIGIAG